LKPVSKKLFSLGYDKNNYAKFFTRQRISEISDQLRLLFREPQSLAEVLPVFCQVLTNIAEKMNPTNLKITRKKSPV